jgi:hypothetical protein
MFALPLALASTLACDSGGEKKSIVDQIGPPTKKLSELKQDSGVSDEEIARRRKEAGFKTKAEIDAELAEQNAKEMEKVEREWIKTRIKDYRKLTDDTKKYVDDLEKEAGKVAAAKDPQKALDKAGKGLVDRFKELIKTIDKLSERSTKGGNTQAEFNKLFRPLEELVNNLGPTSSTDAAFTEGLKNARTELETITKALDDIEKDETLEANKFHEDEAKAEGKKDKKKGG